MSEPDEIATLRSWLEHVVDVDCRSALYEEADTRQAVLEILDDELGEPAAALVDALFARIATGHAAHADEEKTCRERTDNDRLDAALADLEARGIVIGQALGSTIQDGAALIDERIVPGTRGSVFYHRQDLERALEGGGLGLAFTAYAADDGRSSVAIGGELVEVLAHHGLNTEWDGTRTQRPRITPFVWRRRRHTSAPHGASAAPPAPAREAPVVAGAPCPSCKGRGWTQSSPSAFPEMCACKRA